MGEAGSGAVDWAVGAMAEVGWVGMGLVAAG